MFLLIDNYDSFTYNLWQYLGELGAEVVVKRNDALSVDCAGLPASLTVTAETTDGLIMGLAHRERPVHGVQFHPESIASEGGHDLLRNFLRLALAQSIAA